MIVCGALGCASHAKPGHSTSALMPSHAVAPRVATFEPTATRRPEARAMRTSAVSIGEARGDAADRMIVALRAHQGSLHRCYVAALKIDPRLGAVRVPLRVKIGAHGAVEQAVASGGPARLDACVAAVAKRISLPAGAPMDVEVPLSFRAAY